MRGRVRHYLDQAVVLTTRTESGRNSVGEITYTETVVSGFGYLKSADRLVETDVGMVSVSQLELWTDPAELTPTVGSTATIGAHTYEIQDVRSRSQRGINLVDLSILQETTP